MTGQVGEMRGAPERIETIVIGGGQSGLACGLLPDEARSAFRDPGRERPDRRHLAEALGLAPSVHPGSPRWAAGHAVPRAGFFVSHEGRCGRLPGGLRGSIDLPVRTGVRVDGLSRVGDRFVVTSGDGWFEADNVVVAPGAYHNPRVPAFAPELDPAIVQMHSSEYRTPSQLREGGVLVVGAGNSGAEIALEASRGHRTWLSGRDTGHEPVRPGSGPDRLVTPLMWFVAMHVLTVRTPVGWKVQRMFQSRGIPLARAERNDLTAAGVQLVPRTTGVLDGSPVLDDGRVLDLANVIWCTGFAPDLTWINLPIFNEDGDPVHDRGVVESEPGLYFIGMYFLYALSSVLIGGVGEGRQACRQTHCVAPADRPTGRYARRQARESFGAGSPRCSAGASEPDQIAQLFWTSPRRGDPTSGPVAPAGVVVVVRRGDRGSVLAQPCGDALGEHDCGQVGVGGRNRRHDSGVGHEQPIRAVHLAVSVDNCAMIRVRPHAEACNWWPGRSRLGP